MLLLDIFLAQFDDTRTAVNADVAGRLRHADRMLRRPIVQVDADV